MGIGGPPSQRYQCLTSSGRRSRSPGCPAAAAARGLHRTAHAGETGPPAKVRDAVELLGAERVGHGIASMHDPALAELLAARGIALEVCPTSNVCTGALARQLGRPAATLAEHPLPRLLAAGLA